jgi:hypothetical protein
MATMEKTTADAIDKYFPILMISSHSLEIEGVVGDGPESPSRVFLQELKTSSRMLSIRKLSKLRRMEAVQITAVRNQKSPRHLLP